MNPQAYLLPLCIGLTLVGLVATVITWRTSKRRGKAVQMFGLALLPVGLYLTGLLLLVWNFVAGVIAWAFALILAPVVWVGLGFVGLAIVLWVIGGIAAARAAAKALPAGTADAGAVAPAPRSSTAQPGTPPKKAAGGKQPADPELDEIEALLRKRGIE
ncbi:hypothetical protein [Naumannella huperziae]